MKGKKRRDSYSSGTETLYLTLVKHENRIILFGFGVESSWALVAGGVVWEGEPMTGDTNPKRQRQIMFCNDCCVKDRPLS